MWHIQVRSAAGRQLSAGPYLPAGEWVTVEAHADYPAARDAADLYWHGTGLWECRVRFVR